LETIEYLANGSPEERIDFLKSAFYRIDSMEELKNLANILNKRLKKLKKKSIEEEVIGVRVGSVQTKALSASTSSQFKAK
jgi:hypothetical protein